MKKLPFKKLQLPELNFEDVRSDIHKLRTKTNTSKKDLGYYLIAVELGVVVVTGSFLLANIPYFLNSNTTQASAVAGVSTIGEYSIPEEITVQIANESNVINTADFDFKFNNLPQEESANPLSKLIDSIDSKIFGEQSASTELEYDKQKFEYWIRSNFGHLENDSSVDPEIVFSEDSNAILECKKGNPVAKLPIDEIINALNEYKSLPEQITFNMNVTEPDTDAQQINTMCDEIDRLKNLFAKVKVVTNPDEPKNKQIEKEYEFMDEEVINKTLSFVMVDTSTLEVTITNEKLLKESIALLKKIIDETPTIQDYAIKNDKIVVFGEANKTLLTLDEEKTLSKIQSDIENVQDLEKINIEFKKNENPITTNNQSTETFPLTLKEAVVKTKLTPLTRSTRIEKLLSELNGTVVKSGVEFSLLDSLAPVLRTTNPYKDDSISFSNDELMIVYDDTMQVVTTSVFRSIVESGLEITERFSSVKKLGEEYYYPYQDGQMTATSTYVNGSDGDSIVSFSKLNDFKFKNDSNTDIAINAKSEIKDGYLLVKVSLFAKADNQAKEVKISSFKEDEITVGGKPVQRERFTRTVDGKEEIFTTEFYKD